MTDFLQHVPGTHYHHAHVEAHAAGDATTSHVVFEAPWDCEIHKLRIIPAAAVTGANTNTFHLNLINRGTDGSGTTEIANRDYVSGTNESAYVGRDLYAPSTPLKVSKGNVLDLQRELVGTGLASPRLYIVVQFKSQ